MHQTVSDGGRICRNDEEVRRDFDLWSQRLIVGGVVAFRDAAGKMPGPPQVVSEVMEMEGFAFDSLVNQLAWFRKLRDTR